tara:strand:- start:115 stop:1047 length:933 start_codon:yes stop_codon:yes gene_type:complete
MKFLKPRFWEEKNSFLSLILFPISLFFDFLISLKRKYTKQIEFNLNVICVGNIYIGGTGKTPLSILIGKELVKNGKKTAIVRKFYKNHYDEHKLIEENFKDLILKNDRTNAINFAKSEGFDTVILDDGFQDYKIKKKINIVCFNQSQKVGNGLVIPAGPLRENLSSLKDVHIVVINGEKDQNFEQKILKINNNIDIFYSHYSPVEIDKFKNKRLLAVAGIGNPENFFRLLARNNLNLEKRFIFPDHYKFSKKEILKIIKYADSKKLNVIMTEKDYFKIKHFNLNKIEFLKVDLVLEQKEKFINKILTLYD